MSIDAGAYYGLAGPAHCIWDKLEVPMIFSDLVDSLLTEYRVSRDRCVSDLQGFLSDMEREGLILVE